MAGIHGKNTEVFMDGFQMSNILNSIETPVTVDTAETTVFNSSGVKTYVTGNADATITAEGFWQGSSSDALSVDGILTTALETSGLNVWSYWPEGTSTGKFGYGVTSIETGYSITSPIDGTVDVTIDGQVSNGRVSLESLRSLSAASTSGNNASDDNTAATTNGGVGYLQRITNSTRGLLPAIQHSAAGTTWDDLIAFSSDVARDGQRIAVAGEVKQFTRSEHTLSTGSTTAVIFQVGFHRKVR